MAAVDANALAHYGTDRFGMKFPVYFTAWDYGQMSVLMSYLMVPFIWMFGLTVTAIRLPTLLVSLAAIVVLFLFVRKLFGTVPALVALAFAAINPWQIMQSRWALECNLFPHFLLFSMYFLYLSLEKKPYLYLSMLFFGLTMYTYGIAIYTTPLLMVILCIYLLVKKRIKPLEAVVSAAIYLFIAWPILTVIFINAFKLPTINTGFITIAYFSHSVRTNDLLMFSHDFFNQLIRNIASLVSMTILDKADYSWSYISGYGRMYLFSLPFVITGVWYLFRKTPKAAGNDAPTDKPFTGAARFMVGAWLCVAVFSGLMVNNVNTNRINIVFYPIIILASLGIWYVITHTAWAKRAVLVISLVYLLSFIGFSNSYFGEHSKVLANDFCSGLTDAIQYADKLDTDVLYITADSRSEEAYSCSEIYTLFGADIDAHYFQGIAKAYSKSGKALLPYKERYQYVNFSEFSFDEPVGSVYVFNQDESAYFDQGNYDIHPFGNFGVAVKTSETGENTGDDGGTDTGDETGNDDGNSVG